MKKQLWFVLLLTSLLITRASFGVSQEFLAGAGTALLIPHDEQKTMPVITYCLSGSTAVTLGILKIMDPREFEQNDLAKKTLSAAAGVFVGTCIKDFTPHWIDNLKKFCSMFKGKEKQKKTVIITIRRS